MIYDELNLFMFFNITRPPVLETTVKTPFMTWQLLLEVLFSETKAQMLKSRMFNFMILDRYGKAFPLIFANMIVWINTDDEYCYPCPRNSIMWIIWWFTENYRTLKCTYLLRFSILYNLGSFIQVGEVTITKDDTLFLKGKGQENKIQERVDSIKVITVKDRWKLTIYYGS